MKKYQIVLADPPWKYRNYGYAEAPRGCEKEYRCMPLDEIKSLPIQDIVADNATLFLWTTCPLLAEGLDVMKTWGFEYKTKAFVWIKTNSNSMGLFWGMGNWTRSNSEDCLLGIKGKPKRLNADIHQVVISDVMEHSHKPAIVRENIVRLCGNLPRIELFARQKVEGWDCWGDEIESDIEL